MPEFRVKSGVVGAARIPGERGATVSMALDALVLSDDEVHLWRIDSHHESNHVQRLHTLLSVDEAARAARFRRPRDRDRFIAARAALRIILGRYLRAHPREIDFRYGKYGKPAVLDNTGSQLLHFNLSHSGELTLVACARGWPVGVDVQAMDEQIDIMLLARQNYTAREYDCLCNLPRNAQTRTFYTWWTIKEALAKAHGVALSDGLAWEVVDLHNRTSTHESSLGRCTVRNLEVGGNFAGTLAVSGGGWNLRSLNFVLGKNR